MSYGTYTSGTPFTPINVLPEPGDPITYDWMDTIAQFTQRYTNMIHQIATLSNGGSYLLDYSTLQCDFFPPYLHFYVRSGTSWAEFYSYTHPMAPGGYILWHDIDLSRATFTNWTGTNFVFLLIAYL